MARFTRLFSGPSIREERQFERAQVEQKRDLYLATNPLERYRRDAAYREKVDRVRAGLSGVDGPVLDIGGSTAGEATILAQEGIAMVVGDINEVALDLSWRRAKAFGLVCPRYVGLDVHDLPFRSHGFGGVMVIEALHHFSDYSRTLREMHRVLRPGGLLVALEPNASDPIRRLSEIRDRMRGSIEKSFTRSALSRFARDAGFEVLAIEAVGTRESAWKSEQLTASRRHLRRFHGLLSRVWPAGFGMWYVRLRKPAAEKVEVTV